MISFACKQDSTWGGGILCASIKQSVVPTGLKWAFLMAASELRFIPQGLNPERLDRSIYIHALKYISIENGQLGCLYPLPTIWGTPGGSFMPRQ